jgi:hypothetical protein
VPAGGDLHELQSALIGLCRGELAAHKVPAIIKFVSAIEVSLTGKLNRQHA